jgi:hypothetical protein
VAAWKAKETADGAVASQDGGVSAGEGTKKWAGERFSTGNECRNLSWFEELRDALRKIAAWLRERTEEHSLPELSGAVGVRAATVPFARTRVRAERALAQDESVARFNGSIRPRDHRVTS